MSSDRREPVSRHNQQDVHASSSSQINSLTSSSLRRLMPGSSQSDVFKQTTQEDADNASTTTKSSTQPPRFMDLDGFLACQEYIQLHAVHNPADVETLIALPQGADRSVWMYEHMRQFASQLNVLVSLLVTDTREPCTPKSCPTMTATPQWEFLCAAHGPQPRKCCAIDYIVQLLAQTSATLNNSDLFPTRHRVSEKMAAQFGPLARRLYRIFAHGYYHHRSIFLRFESAHHLTRRFLRFVDHYGLMPAQQCVPALDLSIVNNKSTTNTNTNTVASSIGSSSSSTSSSNNHDPPVS